jgi:toxin ParE1/3/4
MSLPVILTRLAQQDLRDIWRGLAEFGDLKRADDRIIVIRKKLLLLGQFPSSGRSREELLPGLRSFPVSELVIFYRIGMTQVEIVRVVHGRQDLNRLFNTEEPEEEPD